MFKIMIIVKRCLIYGAIIALFIPAGFLGMATRVEKAQAAEKTPAANTKTVVKEVPVKETPPVLVATKGLDAERTYLAGEKINLTLTFSSKSPLEVWAELGNLDSSFARRQNLISQGDGCWRLTTPSLTNRLNVGSQSLRIFSQNAGGILPISLPINLQSRAIYDLAVKTGLGQNEINLSWTSFKSAKYLVEWSKENSQNVYVKVTQEPRAILANLESGTNYKVKISALNKSGEEVASKSITLKTLPSTNKQVAGVQQSVKTVTPSIGEGVSTVAPQVAQKETGEVKSQEPSPTPSPSGEPKKEQKSGWSRLLIALAILVIAAGAAVGGYYGYEWYAAKSSDKEPPESKSSNRW